MTGTRTRPPRTSEHPAGRTIDPRIRARRIEVQRDRGRRRLRRLGQLCAAGAVVVALVGLTRTPLLDVDHIDVVGAERSGTPAVTAASGVALGDRLTGVPLARVADRVARLPWVSTVKVTRGWPNHLHIAVVERRQVAAIPARSVPGAPRWVLLDETGRQLAETSQRPLAVPHIEAPAIATALASPSPRRLLPLLEVAASVPSSLAGRLLVLRPETDGQVGATVLLRNRATAVVELGPPDQLERKWLALISVLGQVDPVAPAPLGRIDLRVPSAPALTRRSAHP